MKIARVFVCQMDETVANSEIKATTTYNCHLSWISRRATINYRRASEPKMENKKREKERLVLIAITKLANENILNFQSLQNATEETNVEQQIWAFQH